MSNLTWVYPKDIDDLVACLKKDTRPHGGGTGFLRNVPREGSIADLSALGIDYVRVSGGVARIGGTATYAATAAALEAEFPGNIVSRALADAASPALRNIITVGGSLALFPPWGRIVGPLVALDAKLRLVGAAEGTYSVPEYLGSANLGKQTAIVEVEVDLSRPWESYWYRFSPVRFNYPLFSVVVLRELDGPAIADSRVVLTGNRGRYKRLTDVEDSVRGEPAAQTTVTTDGLGTGFPDRQGFSGDYLTHLAAVAVTRGLRGAGRSAE